MSEAPSSSFWKKMGVVVGPLAFACVAWLPSGLHRIEGMGHRPAYAAGVALWMALWWFTEAVPMGATSLLPLVLFPFLNVYGGPWSHNLPKCIEPFFDAYIFLFMGGMALGAAMEHGGLHRRVALHIMKIIGTKPRRLLLGILVATASVSMWISNTATAVMMVPIGMALLAQLRGKARPDASWRFGTVLMLGIAYASNIGGMGTKIGTATNSIFAGYAADVLHYELGFLKFMAMGLPFVLLFLPLVWWVLWQVGRVDAPSSEDGHEVLEKELSNLGPMSTSEKTVAWVFSVAAVLWVCQDFLRPLIFKILHLPWAGKHYEASVAMGAAAFLALSKNLPWAALRRVPWSTLLLLGGSFAMAAGIEGSGLTTYLARGLHGFSQWPLFLQLGVATFSTIALSAIASNTATINLMLHMLPQSLTVLSVSTLAASSDFALPAGTPPNAIVVGSGYVRLSTMMRVGALLDVLSALVLTLYGYTYVQFLVPS